MLPLAEAGYHVIAPDQRGYGRTTGWGCGVRRGPRALPHANLVRDQLALLHALGTHVHAVIGHDFGSPVAAHGAR
jgi:pimeloyl-ACP methyl ester carboxylesterase